MAQLSKPPIPWKMYRHFAVVTVMLTATLALFAEQTTPAREAQASTAAPSAQPAPPRPAAQASKASTTPAYGRAELVDRRSGSDGGSIGSFGDEAGPGGGYGRPLTGRRGRERFLTYSELPAVGSENAGFTAAYLESLSDEELEALLQSLRDAGINSAADRARIANVLEAASRRRSGQGQARDPQ